MTKTRGTPSTPGWRDTTRATTTSSGTGRRTAPPPITAWSTTWRNISRTRPPGTSSASRWSTAPKMTHTWPRCRTSSTTTTSRTRTWSWPRVPASTGTALKCSTWMRTRRSASPRCRLTAAFISARRGTTRPWRPSASCTPRTRTRISSRRWSSGRPRTAGISAASTAARWSCWTSGSTIGGMCPLWSTSTTRSARGTLKA